MLSLCICVSVCVCVYIYIIFFCNSFCILSLDKKIPFVVAITLFLKKFFFGGGSCCMACGDLSTLARDGTGSLQGRHRVLTSGLPGQSRYHPLNSGILKSAFTVCCVWWPKQMLLKVVNDIRFFSGHLSCRWPACRYLRLIPFTGREDCFIGGFLFLGASSGARPDTAHRVLDTLIQFLILKDFKLLILCWNIADYGEGNGNPLQCSCLENPRDGGAWWAAVYGVAQSRTRLKQLSSSSRSSRFIL